MNQIKATIEQIKDLPNSEVDRNFRQGNLAVLEQLDFKTDLDFISETIDYLQNIIATLKKNALPNEIPDEYIFFLEFYGGLYIEGDRYYFSTYGLGPMSEEWYPSIISPGALPEAVEYGFLAVGSLSFYDGKYKGQYVEFLLDLAGKVRKNCILAIGLLGNEPLQISTIFKNIQEYPDSWHIVADSFTLWLKYAAETNGVFDFG